MTGPVQDQPDSDRKLSRALAQSVIEVARQANSEEDLKIGVEFALGKTLAQLGVTTTPRYERSYTNHGGRSDAVYGRVVIEYEAVGTLATDHGCRHAVEQLTRYLRSEAGESTDAATLSRVVGVGLDGEKIFFLRYRARTSQISHGLAVDNLAALEIESNIDDEGNFERCGPYEVNEASMKTFLVYLRASARERLTADALAKIFGPRGACAREVIALLLDVYERNLEHAKIKTFFGEWDRVFGIIYGDDLMRVRRHLPVLRSAYGIHERAELKPVLFAVHTYYALIMKLLAVELVALQRDSLITSYIRTMESADDDLLLNRMKHLESGGAFSHFALHNFIEADFFSWYIDLWSSDIAHQIRQIVRALLRFEPATGSLDPSATHDLLKHLYQLLIPREIRHDLGEFYTPDWLAKLVIEESGFEGDPSQRVLDPGCGSGTFLVAAIDLIRTRAAMNNEEASVTATTIVNNVVGFDLNPLAVLAARTNYLLAMGSLLHEITPVELPVYMCDSILGPQSEESGLLGEYYVLPTSVATFRIPAKIVSEGYLRKFTGLLDECVRNDYQPKEFVDRTLVEIPTLTDLHRADLDKLFRIMKNLESEGRDGIWARIILNGFAPIVEDSFQFVLGNPPWVNWQSLVSDYRKATQPLWIEYGLFTLSGSAARLGGGKKDISALMFYRCMAQYLTTGGRLGFVITQSLFKSKGAGDGFRRFKVGSGENLHVEKVHDLTKLQPFEGATTQTAVIIVTKGPATQYPVPYLRWSKKGRIKNLFTADLEEVRSSCNVEFLTASPIDRNRPTSPWFTAKADVDEAIRPVVGKSDYSAFVGICTWANGIFWLDIERVMPDGRVRVKNMAAEAKEKNVVERKALIERDYIFPLIRSRDIRKWLATPSAYILAPQDPVTKTGIPESLLKVYSPGTYSYLRGFRSELEQRSGIRRYFKLDRDPFYSIYNVASGTFAPYKVMWRQMVPVIRAAVTTSVTDSRLGDKPVVTQHVVSQTAFEDEDEAHYFCAMLNSAVATVIVSSYSTGKSYGTPSMLEYVPVRRFDPQKETHQSLVRLSRHAHSAARTGDFGSLPALQSEIDEVSAKVYGLSSIQIGVVSAAAAALSSKRISQGDSPLEE